MTAEIVPESGWLWTCRAGAEGDLIDELGRVAAGRPRLIAPALVASELRPSGAIRPFEPTFARQGMAVFARFSADSTTGVFDLGAIAMRLIAKLEELSAQKSAVQNRTGGMSQAWTLDVWVPDTDEGNRNAGFAAKLEQELPRYVEMQSPAWALRYCKEIATAARMNGRLLQLCVCDAKTIVAGFVPIADAISLAPGGRARQRDLSGAPSRAAMKLLEAFDWLGRAPDPGEVCVDLGAAPGGWTHVLLERRARVIAVDPAEMAPALRKNPKLTHKKVSAFDYFPDEPVDWLCCDMAWRPLEVAELLAKWGRRGSAKWLISNIKLPMKQKVQMIGEIVAILEKKGRFRDVRTRQLYHDREEITLTAWRDG